MTEPTYQIGFISSFQEYRWHKDEPKRKRNPIGFVHFGEPEEEPGSHLDGYVQLALDGDRNDDDALLVGFTAPIDPPF